MEAHPWGLIIVAVNPAEVVKSLQYFLGVFFYKFYRCKGEAHLIMPFKIMHT